MQAESAEMVIRQERLGDVAVLVLANPPVNALSNALRDGLNDALHAAVADPGVRVIVLRGEGRGFSAGADISEFGKPRTALRLGDLCLAIEACPKPVIAAIHGMALGGGMELALAAHYRVASEEAVLGLPEVTLGILPGAGGTQRLPRLLGAREALRLMVTGAPIRAGEAQKLGLLDRVVQSGVLEAALDLAAEVTAPRPTALRRDGMADARAYMAAVAEARGLQQGNRLPAPGKIIDLVEAALVFPLTQGLVAEETAFAELVSRPEAAGLRHAFFVERRAQQLPAALAGEGQPALETLGIWGGGDDVADLACQALAAGLKVRLAAPDREGLVAAASAIAARQEADVAAGRLSAEARDADWARLSTALGTDTLESVDLVLHGSEAPALPSLKVPVVPIGAASADHPVAITLGAGKSGLSELGFVAGASAGPAMAAVGLAKRLGWRLVPVGPGGTVELGLRLALAEALTCLAGEGIDLDQATAALARWLRPRQQAPLERADSERDSKVVSTCLAALAAEGARMIEDGRVPRPATVDAIALFMGLVPRWEGGPMFQADQRGALVLRRDLQGLAERNPIFRPAPLFDRMVADGLSFARLNEAKG